MVRRKAATAVALGLLLAACGSGAQNAGTPATGGAGTQATGAAGSPGDTIAFNWGIPSGTYLPLYVADDLGYFKDEGLAPNFVKFQTGAPLLAALKSESLDVVTTGLASVFALGQGIPLTYLYWQGDAAAAEGIVARTGSGVETIADLGKAQAVGAPTGTCAQISLFHAAKKAGLDYKSLKIQNIAPNLYANAFQSASLDAGVTWSPFLVDLEQRGNKVIGFDKDWVPGGGTCPEMVIARPPVLEKYPDLAGRLLKVHDRAVKAIQANPQLAYDSLAKRLSLSPAVAKASADLYLADYPTLEKQVDPSSRYALVGDSGLVAQLQLANETFAELGVIPQQVPADQIHKAVDPSHIQSYLASQKGATS